MMNIMKEAHKMTKEIKKEFPEVDYKFQLGLCLKALYEDMKATEKTAFENIQEKVAGLSFIKNYRGDFEVTRSRWAKFDKDRTYINIRLGKWTYNYCIDNKTDKVFENLGSKSVDRILKKEISPLVFENVKELKIEK